MQDYGSDRRFMPEMRHEGGIMDDNPNPTAEQMRNRTERVYDRVKYVLEHFPQTRGDHLLCWIVVLRKYYNKLVKIDTENGKLTLSFKTYDCVFMVPAPETVRRRCQEIQHDEKERIWRIVANNLKIDVFEPEWREREDAMEEFKKIARDSVYLPTERVIRKRKINEKAHFDYYSGFEMRQAMLQEY